MAVPPVPVRVPSQRPLAPSIASVTSIPNDKCDIEMISGAVYRSPGICLAAEENLFLQFDVVSLRKLIAQVVHASISRFVACFPSTQQVVKPWILNCTIKCRSFKFAVHFLSIIAPVP